MTSVYNYSNSVDFNNNFDMGTFVLDILDSTITKTFAVEVDGDDITVSFSANLTAGEETTLNDIVATFEPQPPDNEIISDGKILIESRSADLDAIRIIASATGSSLSIHSGNSGIHIGVDGIDQRINIGTGTGVKDVHIGNTGSNSSIIINAGIGEITLNTPNLNLIGNHIINEGFLQFSDIVAPLNAGTGVGILYKKVGDDGLFWKPGMTGAEVDLTSGGSGTGSGDVIGPVSSVTNSIAKFLDTGGKNITDSGIIIDASDNLTGIGNIGLSGTIGNINYADFIGLTASPTHLEGRVFYDENEHTLAVFNDEPDVAHQLGQEGYIRVFNNSGSTINNGQVVYVSGSETTEYRPTIALARSDAVTTSQVIGMVTHNIENNTYGYVTTWGLVNDLDTSAFSAGDRVYLSDTVAGGLRNSVPPEGNFEILVGFVIRSDVTNGRILIDINLELGLAAGDAEILIVNVQKGSAGTINAGQAVYLTGYDNGANVPEVELANSSSSSTMPAFGIARDSITNSITGSVIVSGTLSNQNTSAYSVGDDLYVDTTSGGLTNVKPTGTNLIQKVAIVARSHMSQGVLQIFGAGRSNDLPNIASQNIWIGNSNGVPTATPVPFRVAVRVATTTNGTLATAFENGDTIDGVVLATGNRILIKNQSTATENGIYIVQASGAPVRADDYVLGSSVAATYMFVQEGTTNADTLWLCTNNSGSAVVGTNSLTFSQIGGGSGSGGATGATGATGAMGATGPTGPVKLEELSDVCIGPSGVTAGDILIYGSTCWGVTSYTLDNLNNVNTEGATGGNILILNNGIWGATAQNNLISKCLRDEQIITNTSSFTSNSTTFVTIPNTTLTTNNSIPMDYYFIFNVEMLTSTSNTTCEMRMLLNGTTTIVTKQSGSISKDLLIALVGYQSNISNGSTILIQGRISTGNGNFTFNRRSFFMLGLA